MALAYNELDLAFVVYGDELYKTGIVITLTNGTDYIALQPPDRNYTEWFDFEDVLNKGLWFKTIIEAKTYMQEDGAYPNE